MHRDETALEQVVDRDAILQLRAACRDVLVAQHVQDFAIDLVMATQPGTSERSPARQQIHSLRKLAARRAGAGGMRTRAGADARPLERQRR